MYTFEGTFTEEDYLNANKLHRRNSRTWRWLYILLVTELFLLFLYCFLVQRWTPALIGVLLAVVMILYMLYYLPYRLRKLFRQMKDLHRPFTITVDEAGTHIRNEMGEAKRPWDIFLKWMENEDILILYHSDLTFSMFPRRYMTEESAQFIREQLGKNNIPKK